MWFKKKEKLSYCTWKYCIYSLLHLQKVKKKSPPPPTGVKFSEWRWPLLYLLIDFLIFFNYSQLLINKMPENIQKSPRLHVCPSKMFNLATLSAFNYRLKMVWSRIFFSIIPYTCLASVVMQNVNSTHWKTVQKIRFIHVAVNARRWVITVSTAASMVDIFGVLITTFSWE